MAAPAPLPTAPPSACAAPRQATEPLRLATEERVRLVAALAAQRAAGAHCAVQGARTPVTAGRGCNGARTPVAAICRLRTPVAAACCGLYGGIMELIDGVRPAALPMRCAVCLLEPRYP